MKKILPIFMFLLIICPCFFLISSFTKWDNAFAQSTKPFYEQIKEESLGEYDYIYVNKNTDLQTLQRKLGLKQTSKFNGNTLELTKPLSSQEVENFCQTNDFIVEEKNDCYKIINKYSLKKLILRGEVKNTYGARRDISGYLDFHVLCYNTVDDTKNAYLNLLNAGCDVVVDEIISLDTEFQIETDEEIQTNVEGEYDYSGYLSWGAETMKIGKYRKYLEKNGTDNEIVVAVVDTGICTSHPMFKNRILTDENGNLVGYAINNSTFTYSGYDFEDDHLNTENNSFSHGTHVAGTVCDLTPENVKILPIKLLNNLGSCDFADILAVGDVLGSEIFKKYQIVVANLSFGGTKGEYISIVDSAFQNLKEERNMLIVAAAGNDSKNADGTVVPAGCATAITVSAVDQDISLASYSNYGNCVDISAPGSEIKSSVHIGVDQECPGYVAAFSGTSMAAPHVSAAIALLCSDGIYYDAEGNYSYTPDQIESLLYSLAIDYGEEGKDIYYGKGLVNLENYPFIDYEVTDCEVTYDGEYHNIEVNVTNVENYTIEYGFNQYDYSITDISTNETFKNFTNGEKTIYFKITDNDNGFTSIGQGILNIKQKELTATLEDQTCTYGDVNLDNTKYSLSSQPIEGDDLGITLVPSAGNLSPVGSDYTISFNYTNSNYLITSTDAKLTITPRDIEIKILNQESVYGDSISIDNTQYNIVSGEIVNNDDLEIDVGLSPLAIPNKADDYDLILISCGNENYNVTATNGTFTIKPRPIIISLTNRESEYGDEISLDNNAFTIMSGNIVYGDTLELILTTDAKKDAVGTYNITMQSCSNTNYSVTVNDGEYNVTKRKLYIKTDDQNSVYGNIINLDNSKYTITSGSLLQGDDLGVTLVSDATNRSSVGDYDIDVNTMLTNTNYEITVNFGKLKITPRPIKITVMDKEAYYGSIVSLSGVEYSYESNQVVNSDRLIFQFSSSAMKGSNVGKYAIEVTCSNSNYQLVSTRDANVIINPSPITVEISLSSTYGDNIKTTINATNDLKVVNGKILEGDDLNIQLSSTLTNTTNVGTYTDQCTAIAKNNNYAVTFSKIEYKITKRDIRIVIKNQTGVYGEEVELRQDKNVGYIVSSGGIVDNDDLGLLLTTKATNRSPVGRYPISAKAANENYTTTITTGGEYIINKRVVTIKLRHQYVDYSFDMKFDNNYYKVIAGEVIEGDDLQLDVKTNAGFLSLMGNYTLTATSENTNYEVNITDGELTINFSFLSFVIVFAPIALIAGIVLTVFFVQRKKKRDQYKDY